MRENINKVSQRGERLDSLQDKTDNLAVSAQGFRRGANRVRKQMWWKDMKMRMCLIAGIILLLIVIIVPSGMFLHSGSILGMTLTSFVQSSRPNIISTLSSIEHSTVEDHSQKGSLLPLASFSTLSLHSLFLRRRRP